MKKLLAFLFVSSLCIIGTAHAAESDMANGSVYGQVEDSSKAPVNGGFQAFGSSNPFLAKSSGKEGEQNTNSSGWYAGGGIGASHLNN